MGDKENDNIGERPTVTDNLTTNILKRKGIELLKRIKNLSVLFFLVTVLLPVNYTYSQTDGEDYSSYEQDAHGNYIVPHYRVVGPPSHILGWHRTVETAEDLSPTGYSVRTIEGGFANYLDPQEACDAEAPRSAFLGSPRRPDLELWPEFVYRRLHGHAKEIGRAFTGHYLVDVSVPPERYPAYVCVAVWEFTYEVSESRWNNNNRIWVRTVLGTETHPLDRKSVV